MTLQGKDAQNLMTKASITNFWNFMDITSVEICWRFNEAKYASHEVKAVETNKGQVKKKLYIVELLK